MRDRYRIILQRSLLLLVFSGWLASCSSNGPAASARAWYTGIHAQDAQIVLSLTCSTRLAEVQLLLQRQSEIMSQFSSHSNDLSRVKFNAVDQGKETAIVEVTGTEIVVQDQQTVSTEIQKYWQFFREAGVWKWCGEVSAVVERSPLPNIPFGTIVVVVSLVAIVVVFFLFSRQRDYSNFYSKTENGVVRQIQEYETGRIRSFSRVKGYGSLSDDRGKTYSLDYGSFIDQAYHDLTNGERVLFQAEWTERGPRACNVIRIDNQPPSTNPHSRKLIILAERVKRLRQDFRFYKVAHVERELNTCKSFFELLEYDMQRYHIKLVEHEVILLYEIGKDLRELAEEIQSMSDDQRWWMRIVALVIKVLNALADLIQNISPETAELLRSVGRNAGRLLDSRKQPLLGPGKK